MKETFYFSHDYNARNDSKIKKLIFKLGYQGYGLYWAIVEELYQNANALQTDYESIAFDLRTTCEIVKSLVEDFDLFVINDGYFSSNSVERRMAERADRSKKARDSAMARWGKNANALRTHCESNAIKERKGKERKENESKENKQTQKTASQIAEEEKKIYSEYYEYMSQQTRVERIGMRYSLPPAHAPLLVKDFFETCLASILECKNKRHVEQYFHNWAAKPDRVQQSITNQIRIIKHEKGKEHTT